MPWATKEPDIEDLTREAGKLLSLEIDELYAVLGCQLLASGPPTRAAGIMVQLFDLKRVFDAKERDKAPGSEFPGDNWVKEVEEICNGLKGDGSRFVDAMREEFKKGLCNHNVFSLADDVDESKMQILIMIISAILKISPRFESISATLAAMACKSMLRDICR